MAKKELIYGLGQIQLSAIAADGGVGTSWAQLADTFKDSATLKQGEPTDTDFFEEENEDPILTISEKGTTPVEFSIVDITAARMAEVFGGTVNGNGDYEAPSTMPEVEKSLRIIPLKGPALVLTRVKITALIDWTISRKGLFKATIKGKLLTPLKTGEPPYRLVNLKKVSSFIFDALEPDVTGTIDEANKTIALTVPNGTVVTALVPTIVHTGASISPASGAVQDFTNPVTYTVTPPAGATESYVVTVTIAGA